MFIEPRDVHLALERQPDVLRDLAAAAVGADQVAAADGVLGARQAAPDARGDAVRILGEPPYSVSNRIREPRAAAWPTRIGSSSVWGRVGVQARAGDGVVGVARRMGAPRPHPADLVAGQARAEHGVAHEVVGRAGGGDIGHDPEVAEDLDRALVGDVRAGRVRRQRYLVTTR